MVPKLSTIKKDNPDPQNFGSYIYTNLQSHGTLPNYFEVIIIIRYICDKLVNTAKKKGEK